MLLEVQELDELRASRPYREGPELFGQDAARCRAKTADIRLEHLLLSRYPSQSLRPGKLKRKIQSPFKSGPCSLDLAQ